MADVLTRLAAVIAARKGADPAASHTAKMLAKGPAKCAEKFGEEAIEAIIEAARGNRAGLAAEGADVLYHFLVMLAAAEVDLAEVLAELERREGTSGTREKAARKAAVLVGRAEDEFAIAECMAIRAEVFMAELDVPLALERDGLDGTARHYIARIGGRASGTARVIVEDGVARIQRVAVLAPMRGAGAGAALMARMIADLSAEPGIAEIRLDAQTGARDFYARLGFVAIGEEFVDAGIPHQRMRLGVGR